MLLQRIVDDFARGLEAADARRPQCKTYLPGIGPHEEPAVVKLVLAEMRAMDADAYAGATVEVPYGVLDASCDLCLTPIDGVGPQWGWAIEVKAARALRNNGQPAEEVLKHLLSPFAEDRSALSDCEKVLAFRATQRHALLVYGYDYPSRPLSALVDALDLLIAWRVRVTERVEAPFGNLVHPHHQRGQVLAWAVERV